eukprot:scaffold183947_cov24-Tisochrysis_lutea.AAC.2
MPDGRHAAATSEASGIKACFIAESSAAAASSPRSASVSLSANNARKRARSAMFPVAAEDSEPEGSLPNVSAAAMPFASAVPRSALRFSSAWAVRIRSPIPHVKPTIC